MAQHKQSRQGFVNPYNFVLLWGKVSRSRPESHEYFVKNRGRIVCRITFKAPLFIPHPERRFRIPKGKNASQVQENELPQWVSQDKKAKQAWEALKQLKASEEHEMLALLRGEQGKPFIPGSSLKGAFRTVAEALSNSCLSQLEFEWELMQKPNALEVRIRDVKNYYSYRLVQSPSGVGRITRLATPSQPGEIAVAQKYRVFYRQPRSVINGPVPLCQRQLRSAKDGDNARAQLQRFHYRRMVRGRNLEIPTADLSSARQQGILKITDTTDAKNSQRFITLSGGTRVGFNYETQLKYNRALRDGIEQDASNPAFVPCEDPVTRNKVGERRKRHELEVGDIVYFTEQNGQVVDMGPVELYRVLYKHSLDEILLRKHRDFLPCQDPEQLCPACRMFGWVPPEESEAAQETTARKGFVHFSTARWVDGEPKTQQVTLQPLGQPHPSCWQFYLYCQNMGQNAGYNDDNATIRGRKFYWHKPQVKVEQLPQGSADINSVWDQRGGNGTPVADNQNKTVELLLPENAAFEFKVDFENLSDEELGLLLLTLQPNLLGENALKAAGFSSQLYHHFGMGKPLGLGSAEVKIMSLTLFKNYERYQSLEASGEAKIEEAHVPEEAKKFVAAFVRHAVKEQEEFLQRENKPMPPENAEDTKWLEAFVGMPHIASLLTMLDWEKANGLPVQYPPGHSDKNNKEYWEAFRWFTHENQRNFFRKPRHMLKTPQEIKNGGKQYGFPPRDLSQSGATQQRSQRPQGSHQQQQRR